MVNFGPLTAEIGSGVWNTPANFNGFRVLQALLHGTLVVGISQTAALNRGRHLYWAGRPSRWSLAHIQGHFLLPYCLNIMSLCQSSDNDSSNSNRTGLTVFQLLYQQHLALKTAAEQEKPAENSDEPRNVMTSPA